MRRAQTAALLGCAALLLPAALLLAVGCREAEPEGAE